MNQTVDWAEDIEQRLLARAMELSPQLGWSHQMLVRALQIEGLSPAEGDLVLPHGPRDLAALLAQRHDRMTLERLTSGEPVPLKIRDRVRRAVLTRLQVLQEDLEPVRRWSGFLALPGNLALAGRLVWASADHLWHWVGDTSMDENHYSKRVILTGILVSSLSMLLTHGWEETEAFVDARIANVMAFETWKAKQPPGRLLPDLAQTLARMRYGRA